MYDSSLSFSFAISINLSLSYVPSAFFFVCTPYSATGSLLSILCRFVRHLLLHCSSVYTCSYLSVILSAISCHVYLPLCLNSIKKLCLSSDHFKLSPQYWSGNFTRS